MLDGFCVPNFDPYNNTLEYECQLPAVPQPAVPAPAPVVPTPGEVGARVRIRVRIRVRLRARVMVQIGAERIVVASPRGLFLLELGLGRGLVYPLIWRVRGKDVL